MIKVIDKIFSKKLSLWEFEDYSFKDIKSLKQKKFELLFKDKVIGYLEHKDNKWRFKYDDEYKNNPFVPIIIDFPDINKEYEFDELPPFFAARIPNLNQPFHFKKLKKYNGDKDDLVSLLEIFGKKSINNPYELNVVK
jgi:HipA-like protein